MTAGAHPQQFYNEDGEEVFVDALTRVSGPNDDTMPRRLIGMGSDRASATASVMRALSRYDHRPTGIL